MEKRIVLFDTLFFPSASNPIFFPIATVKGFELETSEFFRALLINILSLELANWWFSEDKNSGLLFTKLNKISYFFFSAKTQKEVFQPIIADWQIEYFEALFKKEIWKARWINVSYTYAFLATMWQKSPIGDLIEFISKFFK